MPSNLDILAATDFARNPFLETIVRRPRGDHRRFENVSAVVELDNVTAQSPASHDGGLESGPTQNKKTRGGMIEVAATQETHYDDTWEIDGSVWKAIGEAAGSDAGSKTIAVREVSRITGRQPDVNR